MSLLSLLGSRTVDVYRNKFFHGSTAPFGDSSRQPDQLRLRARLRTITQLGRLLLHLAAYASQRPFSSPGVAGIPGHAASFTNNRISAELQFLRLNKDSCSVVAQRSPIGHGALIFAISRLNGVLGDHAAEVGKCISLSAAEYVCELLKQMTQQKATP
jgi:hypothetical protein